MAISGSGLQDSGLDRALMGALDAELDDELESGELWPGELDQYPEPVAPAKVHRPWQRSFKEKAPPPSSQLGPIKMLQLWFRSRFAVGGREAVSEDPDPPDKQTDRPVDAIAAPPEGRYRDASERVAIRKAEKKRYLAWRPDRVGIVMVHGIGPHLAGQTLLDWTRPIVRLLNDAAIGDARLEVPSPDARNVTDPVVKANIDFSGETFPVVHMRIPRRTDVPDGDPRGKERTWIFTEAWWAAEVRAPTLPTMISWLGEQGGVGRIVQGIQENVFGPGRLATLSRISLQPIVSVITSFVLLIFLVLLGIAKIIPFGPLRDAVVLRLASSFLTDWFGGARTLLRDEGQSANVRHRLLMTIKALRAYGCRSVVIVAHSGGTMVSLTTLTDPAMKDLRVQKLITIGEAINLGWRLNDQDPDKPPPTPPKGDRMSADPYRLKPDLQWRDFWATHDPAPSGQPNPPEPFVKETWPRFTAERVYNRMAILEDHGSYWDNDEHFLIPLIREIDVPTGDRGSSRFYSDEKEARARSRRKERVALLALWRRALLALPLLGIVAAATVSAPGLVHEAGNIAFQLLGLIPGHEIVADIADAYVRLINSLSFAGLEEFPAWLRTFDIPGFLYGVGRWALISILFVLLLFAVPPHAADRLWGDRVSNAWRRLLVLVLDVLLGLGGLALLVALGLLPLVPWADLALLAVVAAVIFGMSLLGPRLRGPLRRTEPNLRRRVRWKRNAAIAVSSVVLGAILLMLMLVVVGIVFVVVDGSKDHLETEQFIFGSVLILVAFHLLARIGVWRWDVWDIRERQYLRRWPTGRPPRLWPLTLGLILLGIASAAAIVVATGTSTPLAPQDVWIVVISGLIVAVVLISIGKDIVDHDIAVPANESSQGQESTMIPSGSGRGPGS
jgi:hypothetical protein